MRMFDRANYGCFHKKILVRGNLEHLVCVSHCNVIVPLMDACLITEYKLLIALNKPIFWMEIIHQISVIQHIHKAQKARAFMPQLTLDDTSMPGKSNRHP